MNATTEVKNAAINALDNARHKKRISHLESTIFDCESLRERLAELGLDRCDFLTAQIPAAIRELKTEITKCATSQS